MLVQPTFGQKGHGDGAEGLAIEMHDRMKKAANYSRDLKLLDGSWRVAAVSRRIP